MSVLQQHIVELVERHGGIRAAARVLQMDAAFLARLKNGQKSNPSDATLRKLGLRRIISFERTKP